MLLPGSSLRISGNFEIASAEQKQKQPQVEASVYRLAVVIVQRVHISTYS